MKSLLKKTLVHTPTWVFLSLLVLSAGVSVLSLRQNNQNMMKLRSVVYEADKNGGDVNKPLNDLRRYVYGHMNTDLSSGGNAIKPPIQLKYTYERLQAAEQKRVDEANTNVYTQAQTYCQQQISGFSGSNRVQCVQEYVTTHGEKANSIPAALYQFDFVSPAWSPDLAGWSIVATSILLLLFVASFAMDRLVKMKIKNNFE